ncbi:Hypothetical_protein [Hexamita inflata]|uniref:Hypothetical_protein n=1 Tax=Hexamita inflata TaxID=28002 RepID=A0AA86N5X7_9EUKA|nr:Hypothetical protein HINF_LOCUS1016 [Hexamita inflata]
MVYLKLPKQISHQYYVKLVLAYNLLSNNNNNENMINTQQQQYLNPILYSFGTSLKHHSLWWVWFVVIAFLGIVGGVILCCTCGKKKKVAEPEFPIPRRRVSAQTSVLTPVGDKTTSVPVFPATIDAVQTTVL